ncbi:hypothetical protein Baya_13245 [Bagarius yarrelli]|uniref:Uncharacterized protein n=1 Tax=Bagarius yarrelli TaxID=175774 RepID=A0A556V566_BAGYA|nr:hypothetical protein Baya_13245 [Bagarius yarrelli]
MKHAAALVLPLRLVEKREHRGAERAAHTCRGSNDCVDEKRAAEMDRKTLRCHHNTTAPSVNKTWHTGTTRSDNPARESGTTLKQSTAPGLDNTLKTQHDSETPLQHEPGPEKNGERRGKEKNREEEEE